MLHLISEHAGCYWTRAYNIMRNHDQDFSLITKHSADKKQPLFKMSEGKECDSLSLH